MSDVELPKLSPTLERLRAHVLEHSVKTGDFTLKSGAKSSWFLDTKQTACRPDGVVALDFQGEITHVSDELRDTEAEDPQMTLALADDFVKASGNLSLLLYKEEIESTLRTPGLGGIQLLGFHDHWPQGTSTIGIVTALRASKGIVTPEQFRGFCSETVPLVRLDRRTFTNQDVLTADVDVAHYGASDLLNSEFKWQLSAAGGDVIAAGNFERQVIPTGGLTRLGSLKVPLRPVDVATKAVLRVFSPDSGIANHWDLWIYPRPDKSKRDEVRWVRGWFAEIAAEVAAGGTVVVELPKEQVPEATRGCFTTLFWNPIMARLTD